MFARSPLVGLQAALLDATLEALGGFAWGGPSLPELMAPKVFAQPASGPP